MTLPTDRGDREFQKFRDSTSGPAVAVTVGTANGANSTSNPLIVSAPNHVSPGNSSSVAIGSGGSFTGAWESILEYQEISLNLAGAPSVAPGTLYFEFSPDGVNVDVSVPIVLAGPNNLVPQPLRAVLPYFRVRYVNGGTALSEFRLTSLYHRTGAKQLTRFLSQPIDATEPVENVRAFVGGQSPDGPFINLPASGVVTAQSTNTPLGSNATFGAASAVVPTTGYVAVAATVKSDANSALGGLVFQFYADSAGTRLVKESPFTYAFAGSGIYRQVPANQGPYVRIKYTNGAVAQTMFEMVVQLITSAPPSELSDVVEAVTDSTAATVTKSALVGKQENGIYNQVRLANSGSLKVAVTDRPSEVRGRTSVVKHINYVALTGTPTVIHTVTVGKIFYLNSLIVSAINSSNVVGRFSISDNATVVVPFILPERTASTASGTAVASPPLPEPIPFTTSVTAVEQAGDVTASITIVGYEE